MSLTAVVRALVDTGCTPQQILAAVEAHQAEFEKKLAEKREKDATRQRRKRHAESRDVCVTPRDVSQKENTPTPPKEKQTKSPKENPLSRGQKKRGYRLPSDWQPDAEDRAYAASKDLTENEIDREAEKFRNYWHSKAGAGATKLDWRKTWKNWCITAVERKPTVIRNTTGPPKNDKQSRREEAKAQTRMDLARGN